MSCADLNLLDVDLAYILLRSVTVKEMWLHHFTPESKQQIHIPHFHLPKAKTVQSTEKAKMAVFWDADSILMVDYLQKVQTISDIYMYKYYVSPLHRQFWKKYSKILKLCDKLSKVIKDNSCSLP